MKEIYIVLIRAYTGLGNIGRFATGFEYTHAAVCLDKKLRDFISFSRRSHYLPFDAGFTHGKREYYAFGDHKNFKAKVFRIKVGDKEYRKLSEFFSYCENDSEIIFDIFSMATMGIFHGTKIYKAYNCMSFTAKALEICGIELKKPYYRYSLKDIDELLSGGDYFEGWIKRDEITDQKRYMTRYSATENIYYGLILMCKIIKRIWGKTYEK